jgi:hypothetical protein
VIIIINSNIIQIRVTITITVTIITEAVTVIPRIIDHHQRILPPNDPSLREVLLSKIIMDIIRLPCMTTTSPAVVSRVIHLPLIAMDLVITIIMQVRVGSEIIHLHSEVVLRQKSPKLITLLQLSMDLLRRLLLRTTTATPTAVNCLFT